uniref:Calpain 14 n=1 Tax=Malurus cyaneus samueli TaxID=2593467 RepID=A0A8C5UFH9_9PASS
HGVDELLLFSQLHVSVCLGAENCWFLAALEALTFHQDILAAVVPQNQSFERKYAGIFHFRFWHFGEWVDVVVDDRLPVNEAGELLFVSSVYKNVFWGALLEKAYAKLYGSYEDLQIGQVSEALVDFTGGVNTRIKLAEAPPDLWDILTRATYSRSLMGCQTHLGVRLGVTSNVFTVTCQYGPENLVRLRNPWGKIEWKGDWSDRMSLQDFKIHFVDLMICKLTPDLMSQEDGKKWMYSLQKGRWVKGSTAGGSLGFSNGSFWMNPQYWLNVLPVEDSRKSPSSCNVVISLMQKHSSKHRNRAPHLFIGFLLYKQPYQEISLLPPGFFTQHQPVNKHQVFLDEREVTHDFHLEPCVYVIVPCTLEPQQESEFILRVFSRKHILRCFDLNSPTKLNATGTLSIQEFRVLWKRLREEDHSVLPSHSVFLFPPPFYVGISLSNEVCNLMAIRYGDPDLQISFESFVCFMLRVEIMGGETGAPCLARQAGLPAEPWPL